MSILEADHARIVAEATAEARAAERRHWEARFRNAEAAHAAALAAAVAAARAEVVTVELVGDYATGYNAGLIEGDAKGRREGKRLAEAAAAPRTLTADDPEPAVMSVVLVNGIASQRNHFGWSMCGSPSVGNFPYSTLFDALLPVTLIHDEGVAYPAFQAGQEHLIHDGEAR